MKKYLVLIYLFCLALESHAQKENYVISGNVLGSTTDKVYLEYHDRITEKSIKDSAVVVNGKFTFCGRVVYPTYVELKSADQLFGGQFWLENSKIKIVGVAGKNVEVFGSKTQDEMDEFKDEIVELKKDLKLCNDSLDKAHGDLNESEVKRLTERCNYLKNTKYLQIGEDYIRLHPHSFYSLNEVWNLTWMTFLNYEALNKLYGYLDANLQQTKDGKILAERLVKLKRMFKGGTFPAEFEVPDIEGNSVKAEDFRGKYVLITFGMLEDKLYDKNVENRNELYRRYHDKGLEMWDVLIEKSKIDVKKYMNDKGMLWKVSSNFKFWNDNYLVQGLLGITHVPQDVLVAPDGKVVFSEAYGDDLVKQIDEIFKDK